MTAMRSLSSSLQHLGRTLLAEEIAALTDAELVGRFIDRRDEIAFTALVRRYGTVVLGVCRRVLRHEQDAEDAFQATFLVFARDAATVQRAGAVGNWLYGVAHNIARKAKAARQRRSVKEQAAAAQQPLNAPAPELDDLRELLDSELSALPDKYRAPIVLCDLMGLTTLEAAAQVKCPPKTLGTRLSRARALLAQRLTRRGITLSVAAISSALYSEANAAVAPRLFDSTAHAAVNFTTGSATVSPAVAALTKGVSNAMRFTTLKFVLVTCGVLAVVGLSIGPIWHHIHAAHASRAGSSHAANTSSTSETKQTLPFTLDDLHHFFVELFHGPADLNEVRAADDKKDDKLALSGTWVKKEEVKIVFEKESFKLYPHGDNEVIVVLCDYTLKDGVVKAKITGFEGKEEAKKKFAEKLPVGTEYSFKWKVNADTATLEAVKGEKMEAFKSHLEGDYSKK
ncbi:MAG: RNA polymerase sigma factor [Planctomycetia bacterium]|nr:RNA polymerase sigma factor [Planctomycetia bacterium]